MCLVSDEHHTKGVGEDHINASLVTPSILYIEE